MPFSCSNKHEHSTYIPVIIAFEKEFSFHALHVHYLSGQQRPVLLLFWSLRTCMQTLDRQDCKYMTGVMSLQVICLSRHVSPNNQFLIIDLKLTMFHLNLFHLFSNSFPFQPAYHSSLLKTHFVHTANAYRQTTDKLMFKSVISTVR